MKMDSHYTMTSEEYHQAMMYDVKDETIKMLKEELDECYRTLLQLRQENYNLYNKYLKIKELI